MYRVILILVLVALVVSHVEGLIKFEDVVAAENFDLNEFQGPWGLMEMLAFKNGVMMDDEPDSLIGKCAAMKFTVSGNSHNMTMLETYTPVGGEGEATSYLINLESGSGRGTIKKLEPEDDEVTEAVIKFLDVNNVAYLVYASSDPPTAQGIVYLDAVMMWTLHDHVPSSEDEVVTIKRRIVEKLPVEDYKPYRFGDYCWKGK